VTDRNQESGENDLGRYGAAEADLAAVRETLQRAGRGEVGWAELERTVRGYWAEHGPTIRQAGAAVVEAARLQALDRLYEWRSRLEAQLRARRDTTDEADE
jgi:hypothetical protein